MDSIIVPAGTEAVPGLSFLGVATGLFLDISGAGSLCFIYGGHKTFSINEAVCALRGGAKLALNTGGLDPSMPAVLHPWTGEIPPLAVDTGTDTACADGTTFVSEIFVPHNMTLTGISYLIGSVGGTDKVYAAIWSNAGVLLGNSVLTDGGATVGTTATLQNLDLTVPLELAGPAVYFVGIAANGNTAKIRTHVLGVHRTNGVTQTHGTIITLDVATDLTGFVTGKGPYATLY